MSSPSAPIAWASAVSRRHYAAHRDELDALIVAMVPSYQSTVAAQIERFETEAASAIATYDAEHAVAASARPRHPRVAIALWCLFFLSTTIGFGIMLPIGGRSTGASRFPDSSWKYLIVVSFVLFALGVLVQLVRDSPRRPGVPPRKDLAWLPIILGAPALAVMFLRVRQDIGVNPLWAVLTAAVLLVSLAYCVDRLVRRQRDPELTEMLDSADDLRTSTLRAEVLALGNSHAERIIEHFDALPREPHDLLQRAFDESAAVLRQRGLIRPVRPRDRTRITHSAVGPLTAVPGILLMAPRIERAWNPDPMVYTRRRRITWRIGAWDLSPKFHRTS